MMLAVYKFVIPSALLLLCLGAAFLRQRRILKSAYEPNERDYLPAYDFFMNLFFGCRKAINRVFALYLLLFLVINAIYTIGRAQSYQKELDFYSDSNWFDDNILSIILEGIALLFFILTFIGIYLSGRMVTKHLDAFQLLNASMDAAQSDYISNRGHPMKSSSFRAASIVLGNHFSLKRIWD